MCRDIREKCKFQVVLSIAEKLTTLKKILGCTENYMYKK